jgi:hypothetical protein
MEAGPVPKLKMPPARSAGNRKVRGSDLKLKIIRNRDLSHARGVKTSHGLSKVNAAI